ncbi:small G protein signaling modulator 2, partial [Elysia marginata]
QYWEFAMTIYLDEVVYIHCHQQPDCRGTVVLVGQDGVQRPPIHFPKGGHLLSFLSCLETGLQPNGQLDPPLWSQKGKGKVFPKLRRKGSRLSSSTSSSSSSTTSMEEEEATDYVFRIIASFKPDMLTPEMLDPKAPKSSHPPRGSPTSSTPAGTATNEKSPWPVRRQLPPSPLVRSSVQAYARSQEEQNESCLVQASNDATHRYYDYMYTKSLSPIANAKSIDVVFSLAKALNRKTYENPQVENNEGKIITNPNEILADQFRSNLKNESKKDISPFQGTPRALRRPVSKDETVRTHLSGLVYHAIVAEDDPVDASDGLTLQAWDNLCADGVVKDAGEVYRRVYYGGVCHELRRQVFVSFESEELSRPETVVEESSTARTTPSSDRKTSMELSITAASTSSVGGVERAVGAETPPISIMKKDSAHKGSSQLESPDDGLGGSFARGESVAAESERVKTDSVGDSGILTPMTPRSLPADVADRIQMTAKLSVDSAVEDGGSVVGGLDSASSTGGGKSRTGSATDDGEQLLQQQQSGVVGALKTEGGGLTVDRCGGPGAKVQEYDDALENLEKLRNIMCTYVWQNLDIGYVQGMCDLVAPLLVIFDDESLAYSCFCQLMKRMSCNFPPHGGAMDNHFANMRSLIQILDSELFEHMHLHGDYTHFYFCYRWFLLDFKRELVYDDVFSVWETIWAAKHMTSSHFVLFIALALVQVYRDIILDNNMDFTDIIKFFNGA